MAGHADAMVYIRTSSLANAGEMKASYSRQLDAANTYMQCNRLRLNAKHIYYDKGVSGTTPVLQRPEFSKMLSNMENVGCTKVIIEDVSRLARDLMVQEVTISMCGTLGIVIIPANSPDMFTGNDIVKTLVRHVVGAVSEFQRAEVVERLRNAREGKKMTTTRRTLCGKPKVTGKTSRLEGPGGRVIKTTLLKWSSKPTLETGDLTKALRALTKKGIRTETGADVSHSQVLSWIQSLRC